MTHYLDQRKKGEIPYIFPLNLSRDTKYNNNSEKNRYEKLTKIFSNLRYIIENNPDTEYQLLKEVYMYGN